jgi:hypothetical protein
MAATIGVYENIEYNLLLCRYVGRLLLLLLLVSMFIVSLAIALSSKIYYLCFQSAGKDAYHD